MAKILKKKKPTKLFPTGKLGKLVNYIESLSIANRTLLTDIFYDAAKMLNYKKEKMQKPDLKKKEISEILKVLDYHYRNGQEYDLKLLGNIHLKHFFDREVSEGEALEYYQKELQEKAIVDIHQRKIRFNEDGMKFLYKDEEGKHVIDPENYVTLRGKRLPWIVNTIAKTREIYQIPTNIPQRPIQYVYCARYKFSFVNDNKQKEEKVEYFVVYISYIEGEYVFNSAYPVIYDAFLNKLTQCSLC